MYATRRNTDKVQEIKQRSIRCNNCADLKRLLFTSLYSKRGHILAWIGEMASRKVELLEWSPAFFRHLSLNLRPGRRRIAKQNSVSVCIYISIAASLLMIMKRISQKYQVARV